ncbi:MAG TPA: 3-deoxy-manno-octulosonate cytidylyltransferase [Longimicrobiales bacterium]|nr:3-deoxy-manno-octulosonate cytidylyltransferase [Longimicrobiales bacterium]
MNAYPSSGRVLAVIPARLGSERLARKPLHLLAGRPLIDWVWSRVSAFDFLDEVVVATDSDEIADVCGRIGAAVEMTSPERGSGTERVAEVAARSSYRGFDVVVNIQGDEPFVAEAAVRESTRLVLAGWDVGTPAVAIGSMAELNDPGVVKVVTGRDGGALYFSRSPIPFKRDGEPTRAELDAGRWLRHIGVYAYAPAALERWVALPASALEATERLEQLRALEAGLRFGIAVIERRPDEALLGGIDTAEDAARAERILAGMIPVQTTNDG